jgi:hypothetical protein
MHVIDRAMRNFDTAGEDAMRRAIHPRASNS